jgi:hypothetical protein
LAPAAQLEQASIKLRLDRADGARSAGASVTGLADAYGFFDREAFRATWRPHREARRDARRTGCHVARAA